MSVMDSSYATAADVAAVVPRYTDTTTRVFDDDTRPTISQVESFINRVSSMLNVMLAREGFATPIDQEDAKMALEQLVIESVADLCHATNSAGRFYTDRKLRGKSPSAVIRKELSAWVEENAAGFETIGATRTTSNVEQMGYRDYDESGDSVTPIFQRKGFGNEFLEWDD